MTRHLIPGCLWFLTLVLAIASATAMPTVSGVERHALNEPGAHPVLLKTRTTLARDRHWQ